MRRLHTSYLCLLVGSPDATAHIPQDSETLSLDLFQREIGRLMGEVTFWKHTKQVKKKNTAKRAFALINAQIVK